MGGDKPDKGLGRVPKIVQDGDVWTLTFDDGVTGWVVFDVNRSMPYRAEINVRQGSQIARAQVGNYRHLPSAINAVICADHAQRARPAK